MTNGTATAVPENVKALQAQIVAKRDEARKLYTQYEGKAMPPDAEKQFTGIMGDVDGLVASIEAYKRLDAVDKGLAEPTTTPVAWRPAVGNEGNDVPVDGKAWRKYEVKNALGEMREFRYNVPIGVSANVKHVTGTHGKVLTDTQYQRAYTDGFEMYCRKGKSFVAENYPIEYKSLSEGVDTAGGFSVPVDFHAELIKKIATYAMVRPNARVIQTNRDVVIFPKVPYTASASDDSGNKRFTSAVRLTWTGELPATSTTARVSDQVFGQVEIKVNTAIASQLISNDLIEDGAFDVAGYAADNMSEAFALGEDLAFLQGTGVAQPMGLVTSAQLATANDPPFKSSGTSADISTSSDAHSGKRLMDVFYNLPAQYRRNAIWMMSSITQEAVDNLVDANKRPLISSLIGGANLGTPAAEVIKGRPIVVDEFMPDYNAANAFGVVLGDFKGYLVADRVQFSVQRYTELYVETNFTLLLGRKRVGGQCIEPWRFMFLKSA